MKIEQYINDSTVAHVKRHLESAGLIGALRGKDESTVMDIYRLYCEGLITKDMPLAKELPSNVLERMAIESAILKSASLELMNQLYGAD
jgi:hypothetical protein